VSTNVLTDESDELPHHAPGLDSHCHASHVDTHARLSAKLAGTPDCPLGAVASVGNSARQNLPD
jgi:hypothetical protein